MSDPRLAAFKALAQVPDGSYNMRVRRPWWKFLAPREREGWLSVKHEGDITNVMWTTDRDAHFILEISMSVNITADGVLKNYFESAIRMWLTWSPHVGGEAELLRALEFATWAQRRLCQQ